MVMCTKSQQMSHQNCSKRRGNAGNDGDNDSENCQQKTSTKKKTKTETKGRLSDRQSTCLDKTQKSYDLSGLHKCKHTIKFIWKS